MRRLSLCALAVGAMCLTVMSGCAHASAARASTAPAVPMPVLAMKLVHGQVSSDSRYLYIGAASARTATIWDSATGTTTRIALPAGCGGIDPVLGSGVAFFVCGAEDDSAWAYEIGARRWIEVPDRILDQTCSEGPDGPGYDQDTVCSAAAAGTDWVSWSGQPECEHCDDTQTTYYNLTTRQTVTPTAAQSDGDNVCLLLQGCDNLDVASLTLDPRAHACAPLPAADAYQPLAAGWIALETQTGNDLRLGRCGSSHLRRLSVLDPLAILTAGPLLLWEPESGEYALARVFDATRDRIVSVAVTGGDGELILEGMVGDRVYGQGDSDSGSIYYVGTLPASTYGTSAGGRSGQTGQNR